MEQEYTKKEIDLILFYLRQTLLGDKCFKRDYGALVDLCAKLSSELDHGY